MKSDKLNQWLSLGANLGVIAGILLLAYEIRQNSEVLEAQGRSTRSEERRAAFAPFIENPELRTAAVKITNGDATTPEEDVLINVVWTNVFNVWEASWVEYQYGQLSLDDIDLDGWRHDFHNLPRMKEVWESRKFRVRRDFVEWMEMNIVAD